MGERLRSLARFLVLVTVFVGAQSAQAEAFSACWVSTEIHPVFGTERQVTRCRISGGDVVDYASDTSVPSVLYPQTGADITGQCWYYTSASTQYVILAQYGNGDAEIGYDADPSNPGGIVAIGPTLPRCTSEPTPATDPAADVWQYVTQYIHEPPAPDLNPPPGGGVTGLDTFVGVPVPAPHSAQLNSGGTILDVYIEVSAVIVNWGDGDSDTYPPTATALSGYPDGFAAHVYDRKDPDGADIRVSYDWTARWRVTGRAWEFLAVPNTSTTVDYPIAEIVSTLSDWPSAPG